jgi:hypothetical protein
MFSAISEVGEILYEGIIDISIHVNEALDAIADLYCWMFE